MLMSRRRAMAGIGALVSAGCGILNNPAPTETQGALYAPTLNISPALKHHLEKTSYLCGISVQARTSFYDEHINQLFQERTEWGLRINTGTACSIYNDEKGRTFFLTAHHMLEGIPPKGETSVSINHAHNYRTRREYTGNVKLVIAFHNQEGLPIKTEPAEILMKDRENDLLLARTDAELNLPVCNDWDFGEIPSQGLDVILAGYPAYFASPEIIDGKVSDPSLIRGLGTKLEYAIDCAGRGIAGFSGSVVHVDIPKIGYRASGIIRSRYRAEPHLSDVVPAYKIKDSLDKNGFPYVINAMAAKN